MVESENKSQTQIKNQLAIFFSKDLLSEEAIYKSNKIIEMQQKISRDDLIYETDNKKKDKTYNFQKLKTIRSFGR